jgi:hypothetical protein
MTVSPTPPLLDPAALQAKAIELCRKHTESQLEGEYLVEPLEGDLEWDPVSLRHLYDQPMVIWRAFGAFEVILDERQQPLGFVDEDKWLSCAWRDLPPARAEALARATGLVPAGMKLTESARGEKDCLELLFEGGTTEAIRVRVNPSREAVISVQPEETKR